MNYYEAVDILQQRKENPNNIILNRDERRDELLINVCKFYSIGLEDLRGQNRKGNIRDARNLSFYIMYKVLKYTSTFTGKFLNRNHATVLSGANRTSDWIEFDKAYEQQVSTLLNQ
jgi:chromosomal replication initiation ATPase DnaA